MNAERDDTRLNTRTNARAASAGEPRGAQPPARLSPDPLFDPEPYVTRPERAPRSRRAASEPATTDNDGSWVVMTRINNRPHPNAHRVDARLPSGAVVTRCDLVGRAIPLAGMGAVVACPDCWKDVDDKGGRMPGSKTPGPSVKNPKMYEALRKEGMSKERAAKIANSQARKTKRGKT